jgi:hypothetical protein
MPAPGRAVARKLISIDHVSLRPRLDEAGREHYRPRFEPGPGLRALGYKGFDLKHQDGAWYSLEQCIAWSREKSAEVADRRAAKAAGKRLKKPQRGGPVYTLQDLFEDLFRSPKFKGGAELQRGGKAKARRPLAARTIADYRNKADALLAFDPDLAGTAIAALTAPILIGLHEQLWSAKGHHMANGIMAVLRLALTYARRKGKLSVNPALGLGLETPEARLRIGTIAEIEQLMKAADLIEHEEVGDAIMLGIFTGQRQGDRFAMLDAGADQGWRKLRQSKTGAVVAVPDAPQLAARLTAARERREAAKVKVANIIVNPRTGKAHATSSYNKRFRAVRNVAVNGLQAKHGGGELLAGLASLADFNDQDLRDTAVTWLADAGCTVPEICSITGHDEQTVYAILKHYLARSADQAQRAIGKLVTWLEAKGAAL